MNCPKCNKQMNKYLYGFTYYHACKCCGYIILTSEVEM